MNYDLTYYEKMLRANSKSAERISTVRWNFINPLNPKYVLDYGSGVGWFRAYRPKNVEVDTYDIGNFPQTGIRQKFYSVVCFWDVLEHLHSLGDIEDILNMTNYIALSVPIKPEACPLKTWKHFKPGEHLHYFTESSLNDVFESYNFKMLIKATPECPPREDILSLIYQRRLIE